MRISLALSCHFLRLHLGALRLRYSSPLADRPAHLHFTGTIRKTQHAAIAYDRAEILEAAAKRKRAERRRAAAEGLKKTAVAEGEAEEMDDTTKTLLEQSQHELMAMEA